MKRVNQIPKFVQVVIETLEKAGHQAWCVGGCVRDLCLGRQPEDWDIATDALPSQTLALFSGNAVPTGLQHGTVTVFQEGGSAEVTTFRRDGVYEDHRHPASVIFTHSLEEDLQRRDFTINAMALDREGTIRDPLGGQQDLARRIVRCVGDPDQRFTEDALRILRALRFSGVLGFSIDGFTAQSIHRNRMLLKAVAPERIWIELRKLLCGGYAGDVLRQYPDVIGVFWPEILPMVGFDQRNHHHCYDVWEHSVRAVEEIPPDLILRCTMLLHDIGKPACFTVDGQGSGHFYGHPAVSRDMAEQMLQRLRVDHATRETIVRLVEWHDRIIPRTERGVGRALRRLGEKDLRRLLAVKRADNLAQAPEFWGRQREIDLAEEILGELLAKEACFSLKQLAVCGRDMLDLGLRGPAIGKTLEALLDQVVDGLLPNEKEALLKYAHRLQDSKELE